MVPTRLVGWTPEIFAGISKGRHIKKKFFFCGGTTKVLPSIRLSGPCPLFFTLILALYGFRQFISIFPNFWLNFLHLSRKKCFFLLCGQGRVYPPFTLGGPITKKTFFYVCLP